MVVVVAVCCMIVFRVKPFGEVSHMKIKCDKSQDVNPRMDFRKEEKENTYDRRWALAVHLSLWEDNKITAEASKTFQSKFLCHTQMWIT